MSNPTQNIESYCIFQIGDTLFAVEATCLREVTLRPALANVPSTSNVLAGLWHAGSEFLPVLRLPSRRSQHQEPHMLVAHGAQGAWGLLVDRVLGIESLDCANGETGSYGEDWAQAVVGTATWNDELVQVLNVEGVYKLAEQILQNEATSLAHT